ncbi:MAG: PilX N-terminal domain-containing pilus assembly protein [Pseudomonas sp.]
MSSLFHVKSPDRQSGSALIISLVLLLLLMLTAIGSMTSSIAQERMAHNANRTNERFQAAETGLRYVEQQVRAHSLPLPATRCTAADCDVALTWGIAGSAPGSGWQRVPPAVTGEQTQVWYRVVRLGDSMLSVNLTAGSLSTLYRISVISQQNSTHTLLEGVYAFTRI